ncbi:hypothetical protein Tco_1283021 [Tanacetum coccineum]
MGDENPIRTLGDYSKPSHEGYRNTIELPAGNNVVPLRSDTIRLVQNRCSFHELQFEDPNQHLKDFLKLVDSLDLDGENRERTRLLQIFYDHVNPITRRTIDQSAGGKLRDLNPEESWAILEDLALYDNESWNDPRDFAKPVKAIALPQDVPSPRPQPQALNTTFEARVRDYMAAHTERMERFENTIFKQREKINGRMTEMFGLLKELTTSRTLEKVLIRELSQRT